MSDLKFACQIITYVFSKNGVLVDNLYETLLNCDIVEVAEAGKFVSDTALRLPAHDHGYEFKTIGSSMIVKQAVDVYEAEVKRLIKVHETQKTVAREYKEPSTVQVIAGLVLFAALCIISVEIGIRF